MNATTAAVTRALLPVADFVGTIRSLADRFGQNYAAFRNGGCRAVSEATRKTTGGNLLLLDMINAVTVPDTDDAEFIASNLERMLAEATEGMRRFEVTMTATGVIFFYAPTETDAFEFGREHVTMEMMNNHGAWNDDAPTVTDVVDLADEV